MNSGKSKNNRKTAKSQTADQFIDASPGDRATELSTGRQFDGKPRSIQDTPAWKGGAKGLKNLWNNYVTTLKYSFANMPRAAQLELVGKGSIIVTMGVAVISLGLFYYFLPTIVRVFAAPALLVAAWFVGTKLVAPIVSDRLAPYLNDDD